MKHTQKQLEIMMIESHAKDVDGDAGVWWWNNTLNEVQRSYWLSVAGSAVPADAWAAYKRSVQDDYKSVAR